MNREQILAMEPGIELDALVTEKVIGTKFPDPCQYSYCRNRWYSRNIAAAWEVVGEMAKRKCYDGAPFFIQLEIRGNECRATFMHPLIGSPAHDDRMEYVLVFSGTMPEAICKASLLAVLGL
jgi:hypothetical protein